MSRWHSSYEPRVIYRPSSPVMYALSRHIYNDPSARIWSRSKDILFWDHFSNLWASPSRVKKTQEVMGGGGGGSFLNSRTWFVTTLDAPEGDHRYVIKVHSSRDKFVRTSENVKNTLSTVSFLLTRYSPRVYSVGLDSRLEMSRKSRFHMPCIQ